MKPGQPSKLKSVLDYLLSFFIALTLFVTAACLLLAVTVCNPAYMRFALNRSGYHQLNAQELTADLSYIAEPIGIDPSLINELFDRGEIAENVEKSIEAAYSATPFTPDSSAFIGRIYNTISLYATENGLEIDEENFQHVSDLCGELYTQHSTISYIGSLGHYAASVRLPLLIISGVGALVLTLLIIRLYRMHLRRYVSMRFLIFGLSGAGLAVLIFPLFAILSGMVSRVSIGTESLYYLFTTYVDYLLQIFVFSGLVLILAALICGFFYYKLKKAFYN
ncbi:MAG: hypothetical protein ACOYKJ_06710 [Candidatus Howiella sp.]